MKPHYIDSDLAELYTREFVKALATRSDASQKCGRGWISPGEVCRQGVQKAKSVVNKVRTEIAKGNAREKAFSEALQNKTGIVMNKKEGAVAIAGIVGGLHGHAIGLAAPTITRVALETGERMYTARTAKLRKDLVEEIEKETAKEIAGGIFGDIAGTLASNAVSGVAEGAAVAVGGGVQGWLAKNAISGITGATAGVTAGALTSEPAAKAALKLKRKPKRTDSAEIEGKLIAAIYEDTGMKPSNILRYRPLGGKKVEALFEYNKKRYLFNFSPTGCSWKPASEDSK